MRIQVSVGRGAKKTDSLTTRVGKMTLTAELAALPYDEYRLLSRLFRQINKNGLRHVVEASEAAREQL